MRIISIVPTMEDRENLAQGIGSCGVIPCHIVFEDRYEADRVKRLLENLLRKEEEGE